MQERSVVGLTITRVGAKRRSEIEDLQNEDLKGGHVMTKSEIIEYLYEINTHSDLTIEQMASDLADKSQGDSVSRQYLLAEIDDLADEFSEVDEKGLHSERWCGILNSKYVIINAPSVPDRPQGEWEVVGKNHPYKRCPFCKRVRAFTDTRFCDWCGARMKGADDER